MSESVDEWLARIGSKEAMRERQRARLEGEINQRVKRPHGLSKCVQELQRRAGKQTVVESDPLPDLPPKPITVITSKSQEPGKRRSKWAEQRGTSSN